MTGGGPVRVPAATVTSVPTTLLWLRDDLRTLDHEALTAAVDDVRAGPGAVVALWIREEGARDADGAALGPRPLGAATRWWHHRSLETLGGRLRALGVPLVFARGDAAAIVPAVAHGLAADTVRWSRRYAPRARALDARIKEDLARAGIEAHSHRGALLTEPWEVRTGAGDPYRVFTPFHRTAAALEVDDVLPVPAPVAGPDEATRTALERLRDDAVLTDLTGLGLLDGPRPWWQDTLARHWVPGEEAAWAALDGLEAALDDYARTRDLPGAPDATSALSPRLRSGEVSPRAAWHAARALVREGEAPADDARAWVRQLYWREFCWHLTFHHADLHARPLRPAFAAFPHRPDEDLARAWRTGRTGIRLVDAGMRQLWESGWMHNRVRMAAASLYCKNMLQPWQDGEAWFWDTLVDADEANNPVSWQWVSGSGADASPYFRIFNPDTQAARFDADGAYVRRWLPEAVEPLSGYPETPVVDLKESRLEALEAYEQMKRAAGAG